MPFNDFVSRADAAALIPTEVSAEIIKDIATSNPIMQLARRLPNMSRSQRTLPVMSALAVAGFVNGDTGLKETTDVSWANVTVTAEELACIVPIPEAVLNDADDYDIWGEIRPEIVTAMNVAICNALLYGTNIPASWTTGLGAAGIVAGSTAAGHTVSLAAYADLYEAALGETAAVPPVPGLFMNVEADGFAVTGSLAHMSMKGKLRNLRDANGNPIFKMAPQDPSRYELDGAPLIFPTDGTMNAAASLMISGQWEKLVYSMRQDITFKILTEAVIQDQAGNIVFNLAQQDMVAMRAVMRLGFALPNPINRMNATAATRYPFGVLTA